METTLTTAVDANAALTAAPQSVTGPAPFWLVFADPVALFASLRGHARYLVPMLIAVAFGTLVNHYVILRVGLRRFVEVAVQATANVDVETMVESAMANSTRILQYQAASSFLGTVCTVFLVALLYWLLILVAGADARMKPVVAVVAHVTLLTTALRFGMIAMTVTFGNPAAFSLRNPIGTNLGFYLHSDSAVLQRFATVADIVSITGLVLTIIGLRKVSERLSVTAASLIVVLPWLAYATGGIWLKWLV